MISLSMLLIWNIAAFCLVALDKKRARKKERRIRERTLFLWALGMGAAGVLAGMYMFRHKTKHLSFVIGIPLLGILNIACIWLAWQLG